MRTLTLAVLLLLSPLLGACASHATGRLAPGRMRRLEAELERIRRFARLDVVSFADGYRRRDG